MKWFSCKITTLCLSCNFFHPLSRRTFGKSSGWRSERFVSDLYPVSNSVRADACKALTSLPVVRVQCLRLVFGGPPQDQVVGWSKGVVWCLWMCCDRTSVCSILPICQSIVIGFLEFYPAAVVSALIPADLR